MAWIKKLTVRKVALWSFSLIGGCLLIIVLGIVTHNSFSHSDGWIYAVRVWAHQGYFSSQPGDGVWGKDRYATSVWSIIIGTAIAWFALIILGAIWEATKRQIKYRRKLARIKQ